MLLTIAQRQTWSLARTLMVSITLFQSGNGYVAVPLAEVDGGAERAIASNKSIETENSPGRRAALGARSAPGVLVPSTPGHPIACSSA